VMGFHDSLGTSGVESVLIEVSEEESVRAPRVLADLFWTLSGIDIYEGLCATG